MFSEQQSLLWRVKACKTSSYHHLNNANKASQILFARVNNWNHIRYTFYCLFLKWQMTTEMAATHHGGAHYSHPLLSPCVCYWTLARIGMTQMTSWLQVRDNWIFDRGVRTETKWWMSLEVKSTQSKWEMSCRFEHGNRKTLQAM